MRIIVSPAKKMNVDTDSMLPKALPRFLPDTEVLLARLREMNREELKKLWKCSDELTDLNLSRLREMELKNRLTPAILSYEGIQYQYMAPGVFTREEFSYVEEHLRILSGFYGILCPMDGVTPYRLEMQAKLPVGPHGDLYSFWGSRLAETLAAETDTIINLASKEYSQCISRHLPPETRFITCVFGEEKNGKVIEKGTMCKMARGEMVRFMATHGVKVPEALKAFDGLGYRFCPERSDEHTYVFLKK